MTLIVALASASFKGKISEQFYLENGSRYAIFYQLLAKILIESKD